MTLENHYKMDDNEANNIVLDSVGGIHGAATVNTNTMSITGKIDKALRVPASEMISFGSVASGGIPAMNGGNAYSIAFWARSITYTALGGIALHMDNGIDNGIWFELGAEERGVTFDRLYYRPGLMHEEVPASLVTEWKHNLLISNTDNTKEWWRDNVLIYSGVPAGNNPLETIIGMAVGGDYTSGPTGQDIDIDDLRIYSHSISSTERETIYNLPSLMVNVADSIIEAIITTLKTITIANGYNTDLDSCVTQWEKGNIPIVDLPCVEVKDEGEESEKRGTMRYHVLNVELTGRIATPDITIARKLLSDMVSAMERGPVYPEEVYQSLLVEVPELTPEQKDKKVIKITMNYNVKYRTNIF